MTKTEFTKATIDSIKIMANELYFLQKIWHTGAKYVAKTF